MDKKLEYQSKAIEFESVYFKRGYFTLADINFSVGVGETVAIQGRSGSGKTTLFELMGNVVSPAGGYIRYFGQELYENEANIRKNMSLMFTEPNFNGERRVDWFAKDFKKLEPDFDMDGFLRRLEEFRLDERKSIKMYSKGMRKKMMLAFFLSRNPKLLLMDEPTSGLDEKSREEVFQMIAQYGKEHELSILFSSHNKEDIAAYADRILVLENGSVTEKQDDRGGAL